MSLSGVVAVLLGPLFCGASLQEDVTGLIRKLSSESVEERDEAARKLRELGEKALPALKKAAEDPDAETARRARTVLREIEVLRILTPAVLAAVPDALKRLTTQGDKAWAKVLVEAAAHAPDSKATPVPDADLERMVVPALEGAADTKGRHAVLARVKDRLLRKVAPEIRKLLANPDDQTRARAVETLAALEGKEVIPVLVPLLGDPKPVVRAQTAESLGKLGAHEVLPILAKLARDESVTVRSAAVGAVLAMPPEKNLGVLVAFLAGEDSIRSQALTELLLRNPGDLLPHIAGFLERPEKEVREGALVLAGELEFKGSADAVALRLADKTEDVKIRALAARTLGILGAKAHAPKVIPLLDHPGLEVRTAAILVLGQLDAKEAIPRLSKLLSDRNPEIRSATLDTLVDLEAREKTAEIAELVGDPDEWVRSSVAWALGKLGSAEDIPRVKGLLADSDQYVRTSAMEALGRLGARGEIPFLRKVLNDPEPEVRLSAARALKWMKARPNEKRTPGPTISLRLADSWSTRFMIKTRSLDKEFPLAFDAEMELWCEVVDVRKDGSAVVEVVFDSAKASFDGMLGRAGHQKFRFDWKRTRDYQELPAAAAHFHLLFENDVRITVDPRGRAKEDDNTLQSMQWFLLNAGAILGIVSPLPGESLEAGATWVDERPLSRDGEKDRFENTLRRIEGNVLHIHSKYFGVRKPGFSLEARGEGTMEFDQAEGLPVRSKAKSTLTLSEGGKSYSFTQEIETSAKREE